MGFFSLFFFFQNATDLISTEEKLWSENERQTQNVPENKKTRQA